MKSPAALEINGRSKDLPQCENSVNYSSYTELQDDLQQAGFTYEIQIGPLLSFRCTGLYTHSVRRQGDSRGRLLLVHGVGL